MQKKKFRFSNSSVEYYFSANSRQLKEVVDAANTVVVTDENVFAAHKNYFSKWKTIVIKPGEENKNQDTVDYIVNRLIELQADRKTFLVGVGGGVVTDLAGYVAAIYMYTEWINGCPRTDP